MRRREQVKLKVRDLRPNSRWFTITVKVLKVNEEKNVTSRDGEQHRVAEALVGDETGSVLFTLWDEDIDRVRNLVGSTIKIRNGYITLFRGCMRLSLGRFGSLEETDETIEKVNEEINISERKYRMRSYRRYRRSM